MAKDLSDPVKKGLERAGPFTTVSGVPIERLYTPEYLAELEYEKDLGDPGMPPYTRGLYPTMYRGKHWTTRQFSRYQRALPLPA